MTTTTTAAPKLIIVDHAYLEFEDPGVNSHKFYELWRVQRGENYYTVALYGRIGSAGQTVVKYGAGEYDKKLRDKERKGYQRIQTGKPEVMSTRGVQALRAHIERAHGEGSWAEGEEKPEGFNTTTVEQDINRMFSAILEGRLVEASEVRRSLDDGLTLLSEFVANMQGRLEFNTALLEREMTK